MKLKNLISIPLATITIMTAIMPATTVLANENVDCVASLETEFRNAAPRYKYVQEINAGVYPSDSETEYDLVIRGAEVTSVSGTAILYKQSASGTYTKIDSESLNFEGSNIRYTGYLKSSGSGKYKIEFTGTAYAENGSERISIRNYGSY